MACVIIDSGIDCKDAACVSCCPVDCIYEGQRTCCIHPDECINREFFEPQVGGVMRIATGLPRHIVADPPQPRTPMPRFAANLSMLYNEHAFLDRFKAAAADGFTAVEYLFPYAFAASDLASRLRDHGLQQVLFNAPPGDWDAGERGLACLPGREAEFRTGFAQALEYAQALNCPRIHVMAGLAPAGADRTRLQATYETNLAWAAEQASAAGRDVLIEPINPRDIPGFFLNRQDEAHRIVAAVGAANLKVQMDLYHCQIVEGDVAMKIRQYLPTGKVGHIQIAGVPMRHEPDLGELHHPYLFDVIDEVSAACGWQGWIGCEYRPARGTAAGATSAGLGWLRSRI